MIAVAGQVCGIVAALWASVTHAPLTLYLIAPTVSLASFALATIFAFERSPNRSVETVPTKNGDAFGLVGFTLLAGFLPNLDFVLLGPEHHHLFLAQRIFLFCAGLIAAIASALFAKQQTGRLRDIWLFMPMAFVSGLLFFFPGALAMIVYHDPSNDLISVLQIGALWPIMLALCTRQILILQETSAFRWVGWLCLALMIISAFGMPIFTASTDIMALIVFRMTCLILILFACQKVLTKRQVMA